MKKRIFILIIPLLIIIFLLLRCPGGKGKRIPVKIIPKPGPSPMSFKDFVAPKKVFRETKDYNVYLVRVDASGGIMWEKIFREPDLEWGEFITPVKGGGYLIAGKTYSKEGYDDGVYLLKADSKGNSVWIKSFGGGPKTGAGQVAQTLDDGYIIAGKTYTDDREDYDVYMSKTDSEGNYDWIKTFGREYYDWGYRGIHAGDSGYITVSQTENPFSGLSDMYIIKTGPKGHEEWSAVFGGEDYDWAYSIARAGDSEFIITGFTYSFGSGNNDIYTVKVDGKGNCVWAKTFGGAGYDDSYCIEAEKDGGFIIAGSTTTFGAGSYDAMLLKVDSNGNCVWVKTYGAAGEDAAYWVVPVKSGGYIFTGVTNSF